MSPDDRYDEFDELLRSSLHDEADTITPAGDGLARIQQRVQQRGARQRWMRPALAVGSVATLATVGVVAAIFVTNSGDDTVKVGPPLASSTTEPPTNEPVLAPDFPTQAIFPFTTETAEQGWEQDYANGGTQWEADPTQVATRWVQSYLNQPTVDRVVETTDDGTDKLVTLGRILQAEGHNLFKVTTVRLTPYKNSWIVTGASDPNNLLSFSAPDPGGTIITPVTVTGPSFGVDEAVKLDVRDATSTTSYGTTTVSFGNGTGDWQGSINFNRPSSPIGALVAVDSSPADGGPSRIVAEQVRFSPAAPNQPPPYFYAVKNNRITQFASRTGDSIHYLTSDQPGGGIEDPQVDSTTTGLVFYLQGAGPCANSVMSVPTSADGTANGQLVAASDTGYAISGFSALPATGGTTNSQKTAVAYYEQACDPARQPQAKLVMQTWDGTTHTVDFPSQPPQLVGDPGWETDGIHVDAFVRTGNAGYLARWDATKASSPTPQTRVCTGLGPEDGQPAALEGDGSGNLWVALQSGTSMDVIRCDDNGKPKLAFTIPGNDQPVDVDVTRDGSAVLLTDDNGKVWRWDGSGNPQELSPAVPLSHVTW